MSTDILYFELSLICALLAFMLDYGLGQPGRENFNIKSLLFSWTYFLAKRRLNKLGLFNNYSAQLILNMDRLADNTPSEKSIIREEFKRIVVTEAKRHFVYEYAIGMCPICTHFWIALASFLIVNIFYLSVNIITFTLHLLLSHLFIRLLNKL
jgi:hypothetical protein